MRNTTRTANLVMTALMIGIIIVSIMFIRIPIPGTQGYVHLGDAMIFLSVLILGWKNGAMAAAIGGALGDIMGGAPVWAPWTFVIKGVMAIILGMFLNAAIKKPACALRVFPCWNCLEWCWPVFLWWSDTTWRKALSSEIGSRR